MYRSRITTLAFVSLAFNVVACSPQMDGEEEFDTIESAQTLTPDVSANYVGRYAKAPSAPIGEITSMVLKTTGRYVLTRNGAQEEGSYKVTSPSTGDQLRLTPMTGANRIYQVSLGTGSRPLFTATRSGRSSVLEREPTSCTGFSCATGHACSVEAYEDVPRPVCKRTEPAWKSALASFDLWGVDFKAVLPPVSYLSSRKTVYCTITPKSDRISCGTTGYDSHYVGATIQADGSFATAWGGPRETGGELRGRVGASGAVTFERFRRTECFQTSSYWCESQETDGQGIPATRTAFELCRTPDVTYPSGGWSSGYYKPCSECHGDCEGGR